MNEQARSLSSEQAGGLHRLDLGRIRPFVLLGQGLYYIITGLWPLLHMPSFLRITGPKTDLWLVRTVAILVTIIGATLALAGVRRTGGLEIPFLALGSAAGLTGIEVTSVARRRISPIYLGDTLAELAIIGYWALTGIGQQAGRPRLLRKEAK